jgi:hypothetical protein
MHLPALQERVIREHFLRQVPRLLLHAATDTSLTLVLDAPDLSLLDGKVRLLLHLLFMNALNVLE